MSALRTWEGVGECQCTGPSRRCNVQAVHLKSAHPMPWKKAKLTPIYEKVTVTDPGKYRMIAVWHP